MKNPLRSFFFSRNYEQKKAKIMKMIRKKNNRKRTVMGGMERDRHAATQEEAVLSLPTEVPLHRCIVNFSSYIHNSLAIAARM